MSKHLQIKYLVSTFALASLFSISSLAAETWIEVDPSSERSFQIFYEPSSIQRNGDISTIKTLKNFSKPRNSVDPSQPYTFQSQVSIQEINCLTNKYRHKRIEMWSGLNGDGKLEQFHDYEKRVNWGKWVKTTSVESIVIRHACQK